GGWLPTIIVLASLFLVGPSTGRAVRERLRLPMNFLTLLSIGLEIQIHGPVRRGRRVKDWPSSLHPVKTSWILTVLNLCKIRPVHKKDGYESLPSRRFCASLLLLIRDFA